MIEVGYHRSGKGQLELGLYWLSEHDLEGNARRLEESLRAMKGVAQVELRPKRHRLHIVLNQYVDPVAIEQVMRQRGFSTEPDDVSSATHAWQDFLSNDRLGDD